MAERIIVVGAGIIGASIAWHLARAARKVLVIEAGLPGQGASGRSFGWINASFYHDAHHHRQRAAATALWRDLTAEIGDAAGFRGALTWDAEPAEQARVAAELAAFGYPVEAVDRAGFARLAPAVAGPPEAALFMPTEGAAEAEAVTAWFLAGAVARGARVLTGLPVEAVLSRSGRVTGVRTETGAISAGQVVVAAGVAAAALAATAEVTLPMLRRPGLLLKTRAVAPLIGPVLVTPFGEVRQDRAGRIVASTVAGHQGDATEHVEGSPEAHGEATLARLRALLPGAALEMESVSMGFGPMPADGLPVVGRAEPEGLYVAALHSGVTLAPLIGKLAAQELTGGQEADMLAPYRPGRF